MNRVLIISYYFPPDGGAGTQRAAKFAKYLPEFGWEPIVLTKEGGVGGQWNPADPTLTEDISEELRVIRVAAGSHKDGDSGQRPTVDCHQNWVGAAFDAAARVLRNEVASAVLITMSPFSLAHLGNAIRKSFDVPVLFDLRDPWTLDGWPLYRHKGQWYRERRFMVKTLGSATGTIANTPEALSQIRRLVPALNSKRSWVLPNGYDAADFVDGAALGQDREAFTLVMTGSVMSDVLYPQAGLWSAIKRRVHYRAEPIQPEGRTLKFLLEAIGRLRRERHPLIDRLKLVLVGPNDEATGRSVRESGASGQVSLTGYLPHRESVRWLLRADALFLPLHGLPTGRRSRIVPGKTYEYLAAGVPILGALPPGDARDLVERSGLGFIADPCDVDQIAARLVQLLELWNTRRLPHGIANWVGQYERRELTGRLAQILNAVSGG